MWTSDWSHLVSVSALWSRCSSSITEQASSISSSGVLSKCFCIVQIKGLGLVFFDTWPLKPSICDSLRPTSSNSSNSSNSSTLIRKCHRVISVISFALPASNGEVNTPLTFILWNFISTIVWDLTWHATAALAVDRVYYVLLSVPQTASPTLMCRCATCPEPSCPKFRQQKRPHLHWIHRHGLEFQTCPRVNDAMTRPKCDFGCSMWIWDSNIIAMYNASYGSDGIWAVLSRNKFTSDECYVRTLLRQLRWNCHVDIVNISEARVAAAGRAKWASSKYSQSDYSQRRAS